MLRFTNLPIPKERPHFTFDEAHDMTLVIDKGMSYSVFRDYARRSPFRTQEWVLLLDTSRHTLMRLKKGNKCFSKLQTEKILQLAILCREGHREFRSIDNFRQWLCGENRTHGKAVPRLLLLQSSFGIQILIDEVRHGW